MDIERLYEIQNGHKFEPKREEDGRDNDNNKNLIISS